MYVLSRVIAVTFPSAFGSTVMLISAEMEGLSVATALSFALPALSASILTVLPENSAFTISGFVMENAMPDSTPAGTVYAFTVAVAPGLRTSEPGLKTIPVAFSAAAGVAAPVTTMKLFSRPL